MYTYIYTYTYTNHSFNDEHKCAIKHTYICTCNLEPIFICLMMHHHKMLLILLITQQIEVNIRIEVGISFGTCA